MTNTDILRIAAEQSALDSGCRAEDFFVSENKVVISRKNEGARSYLPLPFICDLCSYGNNIVASVSKALAEDVGQYINSYPVYHCFETPNMHVLSQILKKHGADICFQAEYFLPDITICRKPECPYSLKLLYPESFSEMYLPEWKNALCEERKQLDKIAVGAYDGERLVGLAGGSADCESMWQIGVDVLPEYRRRGIATAITSRLSDEILNAGKIPFYCCAWSNIASARNAISAGFRPSWVQITARPLEEINKINGKMLFRNGETL